MENGASNIQILPWRLYLNTTFETLIAFYIATFSFAMFFSHQGLRSILPGLFMGALYLSVIILCAIRVGSKLPLQALMIIIPIAPFMALAIILSLIPLLQYF